MRLAPLVIGLALASSLPAWERMESWLQASGDMVASDQSGGLWFVDGKLGVASSIGLVKVPEGDAGGEQPIMTDVAFDPKTETLYGVSFHHLYVLDMADPSKSRVLAEPGPNDLNGLVVAPDGRLLASGISGDLYELDRESGRASKIGSCGEGYTSSGDLVFFHGVLYASASDGTDADTLVAIDLAAGTSAPVGYFADESGPVGQVFGLATSGQDLFAMGAKGQVYRVDPATARLTPAGTTEVPFWGATALAPSP